jgi:putative solute:sodium symporter small subunit
MQPITIERLRGRPYWRTTRALMFACLLLPCALLPVLPQIIVTLNQYSFLGFPLGYFAAVHGMFGLSLFLVTWFVRRQDEIDQRHGANEDL